LTIRFHVTTTNQIYTLSLHDALPICKLKYTEAILTSMTMKERSNPKIIDGRRRFRIAAGSGTTLQEVNQVLKQFDQMQKMMKQVDRKSTRLNSSHVKSRMPSSA